MVGGAEAPDGVGYWLVAADGGIFTFGGAAFLGSAAPFHPSAPIVGMQVTRSGRGYWLVSRTGSAYTFGDAGYSGCRMQSGASPVVGLAAAVPDTFITAQVDGSAVWSDGCGPVPVAAHPTRPIVGIFPAG